MLCAGQALAAVGMHQEEGAAVERHAGTEMGDEQGGDIAPQPAVDEQLPAGTVVAPVAHAVELGRQHRQLQRTLGGDFVGDGLQAGQAHAAQAAALGADAGGGGALGLLQPVVAGVAQVVHSLTGLDEGVLAIGYSLIFHVRYFFLMVSPRGRGRLLSRWWCKVTTMSSPGIVQVRERPIFGEAWVEKV